MASFLLSGMRGRAFSCVLRMAYVGSCGVTRGFLFVNLRAICWSWCLRSVVGVGRPVFACLLLGFGLYTFEEGLAWLTSCTTGAGVGSASIST